MNDTLQIILQTVLKMGGAWLVTKGVLSAPDAASAMTAGSTILGGVLALAGLGWHFAHFKSAASSASVQPPLRGLKCLAPLFLAAALCAGLSACKSALQANGVAITTVDTAMKEWAAYTQSGKGTDAEIITVSNAYNAYYNAELVASNTFVVAVSQTNASVASSVASAASASETNLLNLINQFAK